MKSKYKAMIPMGTWLLCLALLTGCGTGRTAGESGMGTTIPENTAAIPSTETDSSTSAGTPSPSDDTGSSASATEPASASEIFSYEGTDYTWQEITIRIPNAWKDKYLLEENENGFSLIQKASAEKMEGMGYLCGFYRSEGPVYEYAGERQLAYTKDKMYYMQVPTDVSFYYEDQQIADEYTEMAGYITAIAEGMQVNAPDVQYNPEEYLLPMSDTCVVEDTTLLNLNENDLRIARNELFARHGLQFEDTYLQWHFNTCSWYQGTTSPDTFSEDTLNATELTNLALIRKAEDAYQSEHPYPQKKTLGKTVLADLDGNGIDEELLCTITDENEEVSASIRINQTTWQLTDFPVYMDNPELTDFYLTDISPFFDGLEIALLEYGPSSDPATHFFSYDGELHFLGTVSGFPFRDKAYLDGFGNPGAVMGVIRTDLINTCYGYASWWYDYEGKQLVFQDTGYYRMLPGEAHELFIPLPVYTQMNTESVQKTIQSQNEVYFTLTDGKEWLQIKGKDGSQGYVHITDGRIEGITQENDAVFSNLAFWD